MCRWIRRPRATRRSWTVMSAPKVKGPESFRSPPEPMMSGLPPSEDAEFVWSEPLVRLNAPPVMATSSTETLPVGDAPP